MGINNLKKVSLGMRYNTILKINPKIVIEL